MAKKLSNIHPVQDKPKFFVCAKCGRKLKTDEFYACATKPMGLLPVCKSCLYDTVLDVNGVNRQGMITFLKYVDMPFIQSEYEDSVTKFTNIPKRAVSDYLCVKLRKLSYCNLHFKDSIFESYTDLDLEEQEEVIDLKDTVQNEMDTPEQEVKQKQTKIKRVKELREKWGNFDSVDYLERCERLYQEVVQGGYVIKSSMHDLSLRNYCKLQVDWDIAQETKDYNAMRELKQPLKDARTDAKLNPNQFKPTDFTNGGANSFGEIAQMVAKRDGFIQLPMKFFIQPNDVLDFLMYELINYDRHVLGLPECTYDEVYKFYIDAINEFNETYGADIENGDLGTLDESTKNKPKNWTILK